MSSLKPGGGVSACLLNRCPDSGSEPLQVLNSDSRPCPRLGSLFVSVRLNLCVQSFFRSCAASGCVEGPLAWRTC